MSTAVIEVRGVGKEYRLGATGGYRSLRDSLGSILAAPARLLSSKKRKEPSSFWALKDVTFDVHPGEVVGIIGRNGAGKSTLLKILSRITSPTRGEIRLRGQIASLLEVGTGFHPELTGRENVFLNGAIMGMSPSVVRERFDEIVEFSGVEAFLDTPVKRYSSGMRVRLAFSVAAHLQPDILVVDEVLAVGDASFQKKCIGKMEGVASSGRTVLFVSHNMAAITRLCRRGILLGGGTIVEDGPISQIVSRYMGGEAGGSPVEVDFERLGRMSGSEDVRLLAARVRCNGEVTAEIDIRRPVQLEIDFEVLRDRVAVNPNVWLFNDQSTCVFHSMDSFIPENQKPRAPGRYRTVMEIPGNFLAEGLYSFDIAISTMDPEQNHAWERGVLSIHVYDPFEGGSARGNYGGNFPGVVRPLLSWTAQRLAPPEPAGS